MKIRFAQKKDLEQIVGLCQEHAEYEQAQYESKGKPELLSNFLFCPNPILQCLVAEQEKSLVGYATFTKQFSTWDAAFYIYLDCLYLKRNVRGKGLGRQFMERIKHHAVSQDCNIIQWQTPDFNIKAINFYEKIGGLSKTKERFELNIKIQ